MAFKHLENVCFKSGDVQAIGKYLGTVRDETGEAMAIVKVGESYFMRPERLLSIPEPFKEYKVHIPLSSSKY